MGAVVTRLAARDARKRGTKVIYTAHGFHFYNGAARKNWMLFYPVEKALAKDTDCLITINSEDYNTAKARQFAAGRLEKPPEDLNAAMAGVLDAAGEALTEGGGSP